jgi:hypothetical protein
LLYFVCEEADTASQGGGRAGKDALRPDLINEIPGNFIPSRTSAWPAQAENPS